MTGLLHQLGARACMWTGTWRIRQDERTRIIKPNTLWRWKRLIPWKTAGRAPTPSSHFFHMKRSQFYISLLPSFSLYPARLVLAVCHFGNTEIQENWNLPFGGWVEGFPAPVVESLYIVFPTHSVIFFLDVTVTSMVPNLRSGCPIPQETLDCSFFCSELEKLLFWAY